MHEQAVRPRRRFRCAALTAVGALAGALVLGPVPLAGSPSAGAAPQAAPAGSLSLSPSQAKPGEAFTVNADAPGCAGSFYEIQQIYMNGNGQRVASSGPPGVVGPSGKFSVPLTVPAGATRSDIYRPYSAWQYDSVVVSLNGGCSDVLGANLIVLPFSHNVSIELSTRAPRTGSKLHVTARNCYGGPLEAFTWVIDNAGSYFMIKGSTSGTTFTGTADLAKGYRGSSTPTGPAHVSQPLGLTDTAVQVPCTQSEGPQSVADADHLFHLNICVDITIAPANGPVTPPYDPPPDQSTSPGSSSPSSTPSSTEDEPVGPAERASPLRATPTFVG